MRHIAVKLLAISLLLTVGSASAQATDAADSPVWRVVYYQYQPGKAGAWWQDIQDVFVPVSKLAMERNLFTSYKLMENPYKNSPEDWDVMLMIEYANYAALDRFYKEAEQLYVELYPDPEERAAMFARRQENHIILRADLLTEKKL